MEPPEILPWSALAELCKFEQLVCYAAVVGRVYTYTSYVYSTDSNLPIPEKLLIANKCACVCVVHKA